MEIKDILLKNNFKFKKALGQNFISDAGLLSAIARDGEITKDDVVVEIGTGAGTLTHELANKAKHVFTFDVDNTLEPILAETLGDVDNVTINYSDILKMSDNDLISIIGDDHFKVVANLPYYITTPLIMRFIESDLKVDSLTVMVQKEVADRLVASANTEDFGAITLQIRARGDAKITRIVSKKMFHPMPNVDSAIVHIVINDSKFAPKDKQNLKKLIACGFAMRRKTLVNNISSAFPVSKDQAKEILTSLGFSETVRGEALDISDYIRLSDKLVEML